MLEENKVFCTYLKNMFPGLIYRPDHRGFATFKSGKIVITGGKSLSDINVGGRPCGRRCASIFGISL